MEDEKLFQIIKNILNDLNDNAESLPTEEDIDKYIKNWISNNL